MEELIEELKTRFECRDLDYCPNPSECKKCIFYCIDYFDLINAVEKIKNSTE